VINLELKPYQLITYVDNQINSHRHRFMLVYQIHEN